MSERLLKIAAEADPMETPFLNREAAEIFGRQLQAALAQNSPEDRSTKLVGPRFRYALELLNSGESEKAIAQFRLLQDEVRARNLPILPDKLSLIRMYEALAWLRLGEQENCLSNHSINSCLVPIQGDGVHKLPRGSREAIKILTERLLAEPDNFKAGWLLNIAYMTLGEHPDKVPPQWLIPPRAFASDFDIKRFYDVAGNLGLDLNDLAGSVVMDDFDNDDNLDLMICAWGLRDQLRYFHNNGNGTFTDRTEAAGLMGELGGLNMVQADYNNDGFLDVLVLRGAWWEAQGHHPNSLLRNNGDGTFENVTEAAGLLSFQLNHRHGRRSRWSFQNAKSRAWSRSRTERSIDGTRRSGPPRGGKAKQPDALRGRRTRPPELNIPVAFHFPERIPEILALRFPGGGRHREELHSSSLVWPGFLLS